MIAGMVVTRHEGRDLAFEIAGQVVVLKQDVVLERLMPALDLALGLRVVGGAAQQILGERQRGRPPGRVRILGTKVSNPACPTPSQARRS